MKLRKTDKKDEKAPEEKKVPEEDFSKVTVDDESMVVDDESEDEEEEEEKKETDTKPTPKITEIPLVEGIEPKKESIIPKKDDIEEKSKTIIKPIEPPKIEESKELEKEFPPFPDKKEPKSSPEKKSSIIKPTSLIAKKTVPIVKKEEEPEEDDEEDEEDTSLDDKKISDELDLIRGTIAEEEEKIVKKESKAKRIEEKSKEYPREKQIIQVQLDDGRIVEASPEDKLFSIVCFRCYRHSKNQSINQALNFMNLLKKYGCVCKEKSRFTLSLTQIIEKQAEQSGINIKDFEERFMKFFFENYIISRVVKIAPKGEAEEGEDEEEDDEEGAVGSDTLEESDEEEDEDET